MGAPLPNGSSNELRQLSFNTLVGSKIGGGTHTPATIQSGINSPRYATLKGIMSVKKKEVLEFGKDTINYEENLSYQVLEKFAPQKSKQTTKVEGSPDEIVEQLVDILKNKLRLIQ